MNANSHALPPFLDPAADPVDGENAARALFRRAGWFAKGISEHWPLSTGDVAQLLAQAGEYDVDARGLGDLIDRRIVQAPAVGETGFEWNASDLLEFIGCLERRQQWKATPSIHDAKKHDCQLILEQAREVGQVAAITAGPGFQGPRLDVPHLLVLLIAEQTHEGRMKIAVLLRATLEVEHGVIV